MATRRLLTLAALSVGWVTLLAAQSAPAPTQSTDHVAAIKQSLQKSMAALHQYEWVETTTVSYKGEEKSQTESSCYYGADGQVVKTPMGQPAAPEKKPRGLRGRVAEKKKDDISDSVKEAVGLVKQYVPPDPARIQAAKEAGRLSVTPPDDAGNVSVVIHDYLKEGDSLTLAANAAANRVTGVTVATFTDSAKDAVTLNVAFGTFTDGTVYPENVNLDVAAESLSIAIQNSGYRKLGG